MNPTQQLLFSRALEVRKHAYAPYSQFQVGAALLTSSGQVFTGCNVENISYGLTICAETNAVTLMVAEGGTQIDELLLIGGGTAICSPCGTCRQIIREFAKPTTLIHLCNIAGEYQTKTIDELLPFSFNSTCLSRS